MFTLQKDNSKIEIAIKRFDANKGKNSCIFQALLLKLNSHKLLLHFSEQRTNHNSECAMSIIHQPHCCELTTVMSIRKAKNRQDFAFIAFHPVVIESQLCKLFSRQDNEMIMNVLTCWKHDEHHGIFLVNIQLNHSPLNNKNWKKYKI